MSEELKLYIKTYGDKRTEYLYGPSWKSTELLVEGGYPTPEEAKAAWELEEQRLHQEFCLNCCEKRNYHVSRRQVKVKVRDIEFTCPEYVAYCASCAKEIHVPTVHDMNVGLRKRYYKDACSRNTPV